jgi:hypothetical protein
MTFEERQEKIAHLRQCCGRCGREIGHSWECGWPLHGMLDLGFPAQSFAALRGSFACADESDFAWWKKGHPAMQKNEAQHVIFSWSREHDWRLCYDCQRALLTVIGAFFGINDGKKATIELLDLK